MKELDGYSLGIVQWLALNADPNGVLVVTLDQLVEGLRFPKKVIRSRLQALTEGHVLGHAKGNRNLTLTLFNHSEYCYPGHAKGTQRARSGARRKPKNTVEIPIKSVAPEATPRVFETPKAKPQTPGSYAFECYAKYQLIKYKAPPLRDKMANTHAKSIAESIPREDLDQFFKCYHDDNDAFYLNARHPLGLAKKDVHKIYTQLQTGMRISIHKARQYEMASETQDAANRFMERKYGTGFEAKP